MQKTLRLSSVLVLLAAAGCNEPKPAGQAAASAVSAATPAADPAVAQLQQQITNAKAGDVYVVQFQPPGGAAKRYFFYHLFRATPDSFYLHPARKDAPTATADLTQPDYQASAATMVYTRAELTELLHEQPGDVNKARLVQVRRAE